MVNFLDLGFKSRNGFSRPNSTAVTAACLLGLFLGISGPTAADAPSNAERYDKILVSFENGDFKKCLIDDYALINTDADDPAVANGIFLAGYLNQFAQGDLERASFYYEKLLKKFPRHPAAVLTRKYLADCYFLKGAYEKAREGYTALGDLAEGAAPENFDEIQYRLAICYYYAKDYTGSVRELQKLLKKFPKSQMAPSALFLLARSYQDKDDPERARSVMARLAGAFPKHPLAAEPLVKQTGGKK